MKYDEENDRVVNDDGDLQLKPSQDYWHNTNSIEIETDVDYISLPVSQIDELIAGLEAAKKLTET